MPHRTNSSKATTNRLLDYRPRSGRAVEPVGPEENDGWLAQRLTGMRSFLEESMSKYPATTLVVGLSIGVALGWLIKRRGTGPRKRTGR